MVRKSYIQHLGQLGTYYQPNTLTTCSRQIPRFNRTMPKGVKVDLETFVAAVASGKSQSDAAMLSGSTSADPGTLGSRLMSRPGVAEAIEARRKARTARLEAAWDRSIAMLDGVVAAPAPKAQPTYFDRLQAATIIGRAAGAFIDRAHTVIEHRTVPLRSLLTGRIIDADATATPGADPGIVSQGTRSASQAVKSS